MFPHRKGPSCYETSTLCATGVLWQLAANTCPVQLAPRPAAGLSPSAATVLRPCTGSRLRHGGFAADDEAHDVFTKERSPTRRHQRARPPVRRTIPAIHAGMSCVTKAAMWGARRVPVVQVPSAGFSARVDELPRMHDGIVGRSARGTMGAGNVDCTTRDQLCPPPALLTCSISQTSR